MKICRTCNGRGYFPVTECPCCGHSLAFTYQTCITCHGEKQVQGREEEIELC